MTARKKVDPLCSFCGHKHSEHAAGQKVDWSGTFTLDEGSVATAKDMDTLARFCAGMFYARTVEIHDRDFILTGDRDASAGCTHRTRTGRACRCSAGRDRRPLKEKR